MADIDWATFGPLMAKMFAEFMAAERTRTGLTDEQIFQRAGVEWDETIAKLMADVQRLQGQI